MRPSNGFSTAWRLPLLLFGSLSCCLIMAAAVAAAQPSSCPADVITIEDAATAVVINLQPGSSYQLGSGMYILNRTVEVPTDAALW
jgi:hypothetical protein